jgi:hypothetical protein
MRQSPAPAHGFMHEVVPDTIRHTSPSGHAVDEQSDEQYPPSNGRQYIDWQLWFESHGSPVLAPRAVGLSVQPDNAKHAANKLPSLTASRISEPLLYVKRYWKNPSDLRRFGALLDAVYDGRSREALMPRTIAWFALALALAAPPAGAQEPAPTPTNGAPNDPFKPAPAKPDDTSPISSNDLTTHYALGLQAHYLNVPDFMLKPFLQSYTTLSSAGFGGYFVRRNGSLDIVVSVDFGFYSPPDGNYLGANKDPTLDTHYTQFKGLNFLSLDVGFFYVHDLTSWLAFTIGGGVGIGAMLGDIMVVNNSQTVCGPNNVTDPNKCYPVNPNTGMAVKPSDPNFQAELEQLKSPKDTAQNPNYHASGDKPPVMVVVNFQIGFKIKLHRHFGINITGGFRDGFVVGGGPEFVF